MTRTPENGDPPAETIDALPIGPERWAGLRLARKLLLYHITLAAVVIATTLIFPNFAEQLPVGGVRVLAETGDATIGFLDQGNADSEEAEIVSSIVRATRGLDRLGYARKLALVLVGVWLLMLPVSWVRREIDKRNAHDRSLDETTLVLPGVVAAIVLVVQHSLALAFSLAGIVAGVQFRRALQDTFDALFILVAIGSGIAAGVEALEIAAVLTVFFTYATMYVYFLGDGLESDYVARKKLLKKLRHEAVRSATEKDESGESTDS